MQVNSHFVIQITCHIVSFQHFFLSYSWRTDDGNRSGATAKDIRCPALTPSSALPSPTKRAQPPFVISSLIPKHNLAFRVAFGGRLNLILAGSKRQTEVVRFLALTGVACQDLKASDGARYISGSVTEYYRMLKVFCSTRCPVKN